MVVAGWVFLVNKLAGKSLETPPHQDNHYLKLHPPNCLTIWHAPPPSMIIPYLHPYSCSV